MELFSSWVILSEDVTEKYVKFLIQDLNNLILIMNKYKGKDVDKMKSAKDQHLRKAFVDATSAKTLFGHFDQQGFSSQKAKEDERRTIKLESCRQHLAMAHKYLK